MSFANSTSPLKFAILISGRGSNMQAIVQQCQQNPQLQATVVIANKHDASGLHWAQGQGLETAVLSHKDYATRQAYDVALMQLIDKYEVDYVLLAGFMRILSAAFVAHYAGKLINIHPSILPAFTGLNTHERAIQSAVKVHGATIHYVTAELDAGPIICQSVVPVKTDDTVSTLAQRVLATEHTMYAAVVNYLAKGSCSLIEGRTHWHRAEQTLFMHPDLCKATPAR
ncbi:phosphoribosylglycinamide formyltransferase [Brackiella oedipodis]|uniref:phosphoribosylglycinamide formyltransferase n=1 Tax=Brackiella oedipodis TaxID=124225 RepID=UPI000571E8D0|nr:phosphoribosylglycinamide formyltransferase [Brackiella oedipodis]